MQSTSNYHKESSWKTREEVLKISLERQPLIILLRISEKDLEEYNLTSVFCLINRLIDQGVKNMELAWSPHVIWPSIAREILKEFKNISFGAASINNNSALKLITDIGFSYAMSPFLDENILQEARALGQLLIPGVVSPSEIQRAIKLNCQIIKLFPASTFGIHYLNQLKVPFSSLPFVIAAGGLKVKDLDLWLHAGHHAIVLGRGLFKDNEIDPILKRWLKKNLNSN